MRKFLLWDEQLNDFRSIFNAELDGALWLFFICIFHCQIITWNIHKRWDLVIFVQVSLLTFWDWQIVVLFSKMRMANTIINYSKSSILQFVHISLSNYEYLEINLIFSFVRVPASFPQQTRHFDSSFSYRRYKSLQTSRGPY